MIQTILTLLFTWALINIEKSSYWWLIFGLAVGIFWAITQQGIEADCQKNLLPGNSPTNKTTEAIWCQKTLFLFGVVFMLFICFWGFLRYLRET